MKYAQQYLLSAKQIIDNYDGAMPFAAHLKKHFAEHKKYGSKDRRNIAHLCYAYYRIGRTAMDLPFETRCRIAIFLTNNVEDGWSVLFEQHWINNWFNQLEEKIKFVKHQFPSFQIRDLFPGIHAISNQIESQQFCVSHFTQPDVFIRIRPGKLETVIKKLIAAEITYNKISDTCIALPNAVKIDAIVQLDKEVVVQDKSSQRIVELLAKIVTDKTKAIQLWDCCAASGGKTILARDYLGVMDMTVSDIRASILHNLSARFERAGIKHFHSITTDISKPNPQLPDGKFDLIIADVPCSGSGTWGRTPEQLAIFKEEKIKDYQQLQKSIVSNILSALSAKGYLLYSTCSVFKAENEDIRDYILAQDSTLEIVAESYLIGYQDKADSMYACLFRKLK